MKKESVPNNSFYNSNFKNKKILIIVPHQDDELFLCGTILDSLRKVTSNIYVAFVTNGDYGNDFNQRYIECLSAMKIFQISSKNVICLGYGDQYETKYGHIYHAPMEEIVMSKRGSNTKLTLCLTSCYTRMPGELEFLLLILTVLHL